MKPFISSRLAEIIFALLIGYFGYLHFKNVYMMIGSVPQFMPGDAQLWVYIAGSGLLLAALAIISGFQKTLACYLLAAELLIIVITVHLKPALNNYGPGIATLIKDTALAMGAIIIGNRK